MTPTPDEELHTHTTPSGVFGPAVRDLTVAVATDTEKYRIDTAVDTKKSVKAKVSQQNKTGTRDTSREWAEVGDNSYTEV